MTCENTDINIINVKKAIIWMICLYLIIIPQLSRFIFIFNFTWSFKSLPFFRLFRTYPIYADGLAHSLSNKECQQSPKIRGLFLLCALLWRWITFFKATLISSIPRIPFTTDNGKVRMIFWFTEADLILLPYEPSWKVLQC